VIVDYIQLMQGRGRFENRTLELGAISRSLKGLAKELNVPIVVLSQLSRAPESRSDHRPQLSDLRESGALEQDADVVVFIFREDQYLDKTQPPTDSQGVAELIIGKQRNGPTGVVKLAFIKEFTRFENLAVGS
jgi:replicative DNA helicase